MQKQAPSIGRIAVALGFTLSCFGLMLFLWIAFGGPSPLKPKSYRVSAYFPEATQLAIESDIRIGGVSVGKVKAVELAPPERRVNGKDTTEAVLEIEPRFAPISSDARAILRQKTLLGETYIELTSGTEPGSAKGVALGEAAAAAATDAGEGPTESVPEGGTLPETQTQEATQIDEIFNALDEETRASFQNWMKNSAEAIEGRGLDFNDALGNLGPFADDTADVLATLKRQKLALKGLVRDAGLTFQALSERDQELAGAIVGSERTFDALARERDALAETFQIFPTFERESRKTLVRLDQFAANTRPLIQDLIPAARDISPTLKSVRQLSPNLRRLFVNLRTLVDVSVDGLPALRDTIADLTPTLDALDPFLANLNPIIRYLDFQRGDITNFLSNPPVGLSGLLPPVDGQSAPRHALRQISYLSAESLSTYPVRLPTNRGNGYPLPGFLHDFRGAQTGIFPNFDCDNTGVGGNGEKLTSSPASAACIIADDFPAIFGGGHAPNLFADP